ncbi:hypothetical protein PM023_13105 [Halorubrum ezzemoulense]|uniref:hypothetical protein n=1 Tax=Halorubrum ezzemoulense TaxID=337243 RepID=UPI002330D37B|nr:hypothetical protein [Halorubrum ezzemoulense]MDB2225608.1 hypothetical protein [Halorubrum ezzemoulense]
MSLSDRIRSRTNQARKALLRSEPAPQTRQNSGDYAHFSVRGEVNRVGPDQGDLEQYWDQYRSNPLVRRGIDIFADDVVAPGYRVDADSDELVAELEEWLSTAAIVGGESHRDFTEILEGSVIHEEVRGTAMVEKVPTKESPDETWGFRLVNPSTVEAYTYDSQAVLIRPDDTETDGVQLTPRGDAAAYGQWGDGALAGPFNKDTVYLSQDDVVKLIQDPDTADIFGNSTIEPVSQEIAELNRMIHDLGEAIHSKSYPHWIFKLGEPEGDAQNPRAGIWPEEEMKSYRNKHKKGNWEVGNKDFVPGDVEVETISSDVPEIENILNWIVEEIIAALPVPKYKLAHTDNINRDVTSEQAPQYERRIESKRHRLQNAFTPVLQEKAEQLGYGPEVVSTIELSIEEPREENPLERDGFDAEEFAQFAQGLKAVSGGDGSPRDIVSADEMRGLLGLPDRDDVDESALESGLDESDENVRAEFEELYGEPATPDSVGDGADVELDTSADDGDSETVEA